MKKVTLKVMRGSSRYNTTTKRWREAIVEWILSRLNVSPSCESSNVVTVFNP